LSSLARDTRQVFEGGRLASVKGYELRARQVDMAVAVAEAMDQGGVHLFEAGTGVGKSLAYLVPAMLGGLKVLVSTATRTLQDQLFDRDIPDLRAGLGLEVTSAILKGRANYLCRRKWLSGRGAGAPAEFFDWVSVTSTGDVSELEFEPDQELWGHLRSDAVDCLGPACPSRGNCFFQSARVLARKSDVVVLNHHLLLSGVCGEDLLPDSEVLIADEGHRIEDAAAECLGISLSPLMLLPLFDGIAFSSASSESKAALLERARRLQSLVEDLAGPAVDAAEWDPDEATPALEEAAGEARALSAALEGADDLASAAAVADQIGFVCTALVDAPREDYCFFREPAGRNSRIRAVPLDLGEAIRRAVYSRFRATVLTSATLAVAGSFDYSSERLGAWNAESVRDFGSPFDYSSQAVLTVPDDLPEPDEHESLAGASWVWASRLAGILGGRTLVLFTSYRNLALAADAARREPLEGIRLLVQGEMTRTRILTDFRSDSRGVIMGTSSFWEGVDLPGRLLQAVIIDRLPFPSPGHPLTAARIRRMDESGRSSFRELTLPSAVIRLRQGVGRLIRSARDRGVVLILDRRLRTSSYGNVISRSLPAFRMAGEEEMLAFAATECAGMAGE
jgi:ATP-dependent DNA helicase DinG